MQSGEQQAHTTTYSMHAKSATNANQRRHKPEKGALSDGLGCSLEQLTPTYQGPESKIEKGVIIKNIIIIYNRRLIIFFNNNNTKIYTIISTYN